MLPAATLGISALVGFVAGLLIGAVGVGGVLLVPILIHLDGLDVHSVVRASMAAYIAAGLAGMSVFARKESISWRHSMPLLVAAFPFAGLGSYILTLVSGFALLCTLYSLLLITSVFSLIRTLRRLRQERRTSRALHSTSDDDHLPLRDLQRTETATSLPSDDTACLDGEQQVQHTDLPSPPPPESEKEDDGEGADSQACEELPPRRPPTRKQDILSSVFGAITGFASSLTGSSGPVILLPILSIADWPLLASLGCAQAVQVPIALAATLVTVALKEPIEWALAGVLAISLSPAVLIGALVAHHVPQTPLKLTVTLTVVVGALVLLIRLLATQA